MPEAQTDDVMDSLADLSPASRLSQLRRQRPDIVAHIENSDHALFSPREDGGLSRRERLSAALRIARLLGDSALESHYQTRLMDSVGATAETVILPDDRRHAAIASHVDCVIRDPHGARKADIDALLADGLSPHAVVSLSQLIAYVSFQSRVLAGLRMMRDAR